MNTDPALVGLPAGLSPEDAATQFDSLQKKLVPLWRSIESFNQDEQTIVVVPSMSIDMVITGLEVQAYEERFLFLLLLLTQPRARMIYLTSQAIHPSVIEYYLDLLPGIIPRHALRRLTCSRRMMIRHARLASKSLSARACCNRSKRASRTKTALISSATTRLTSSEILPSVLASLSMALTRVISLLGPRRDAGSCSRRRKSITRSVSTG